MACDCEASQIWRCRSESALFVALIGVGETGECLQEHMRMGQAIGPLRDEGVLLFGSGLSYHSMSGFSRNGDVSHASVESRV